MMVHRSVSLVFCGDFIVEVRFKGGRADRWIWALFREMLAFALRMSCGGGGGLWLERWLCWVCREGGNSAGYGLGTGSGTIKGGKGISIRGESRVLSVVGEGGEVGAFRRLPCILVACEDRGETFQGMFAKALY